MDLNIHNQHLHMYMHLYVYELFSCALMFLFFPVIIAVAFASFPRMSDKNDSSVYLPNLW